ncbi:hypothetical protein Q4503_11120 [Colwellia sp. 6_MG-2023]|uniref:hypothetical protein n=1 Tax=Colwellia sp. 6_MG-2023 TaxID=3062676 RepID=UPI0026E2CF41|nr:hypothetical protein [Colwellia sp. 6_MG-2023]MDO6488255.1 hypothetical protein [Colwellia sp. 6_MG-2023]
MSDDFKKKLKERLNKALKEVEPSAIASTGSQSIKGNGNTQVGNSQKLEQSIEGNNNVQVAGDA